MRVGWWIMLVASGLAVACSLLTQLDEPRDAGTGSDAALCTPEVIVDLGTDAGITSLYVDQVGGKAYFVSTPLGNVYSVGLDAGAGSTPSTVMTNLPAPERITGSQDKGALYLFVAAFGRAAGEGGLYVVPPDGGLQSIVDSGTPIHAYGVTAQGIFPPSLYWSTCTQPGCNTGVGEILLTSLSNSTTTTLATTAASGPRDIVITDQGSVWWVDMSATLNTIASDGGLRQLTCGGVLTYAASHVYYTTANECSSSDVIRSIATDDPNATPTVFDDNSSGLVDGPSSLAFDGSKYLYWANLTGATIARKDTTTTSATDEAVASSPNTPRQLVWIPPGILYWTTDSGLVRCAL